MSMSDNITLEDGGKITLPDEVLERYGLAQDVSLRMIETRSGILLIPLTDEPMSQTLLSEVEEWQALGMENLWMFPFDDEEQKA